nr:hypothetical protein [Tanacetum cinerariifolium]
RDVTAGIGHKGTWGGRVKLMVLFRWSVVHGRGCREA